MDLTNLATALPSQVANSAPSSTPGTCHLLRFPGEVRNRVYSALFDSIYHYDYP
ncbi:hypothetical protein LTR09_001921 [Extremus antarcticus]|uniref:Uncharacterized protein n=1 Tax=Extremus antarcticus TaxID=702011 RepID=A0AAJ0GG56_9PEZI|nr:hypothetical protein LTR09_001921 [Extremus antarcticus]